jgi:hypothetical protein
MQVANVITYEQADLICAVINRFSNGGHPVAQVDGLRYFEFGYVKKLAKKARPHLRDERQSILDEAIAALQSKN